jgi:subtilisin family serine protease
MKLPAVLLLAGVCLPALAVTIHAQGKDSGGAPNGVRRVSRPLRGHYIVVLRGNDDPEAVGLEAAILQRGRLRHVFRRAARGFAIQMSEAAARALANDPRVAFVEEDALVETAGSTQTGAPWGLDRIDQRALPLDTQYQYARDGAGVHVHVLDSGIRTTHTEFGGRAFVAADYIDDDNDGDPYDTDNDDLNPLPDGGDCHGHGTHVAGTIGGATFGVAKNVMLWAHRVLDCTGSGPLSGVIAAVDAVTADTAHRPAVVNMSLAGPASAALDLAIRESIAAGVTYVVAAGNNNVDASTSSPSRIGEAITVGATASNDARASFSNYGPALDLFAPGVSIRSAGISTDIATASMSGTSMAAPHVAGVVALYLQENPAAAPAAVRDAIVAESTPGLVSNGGAGSPNLLLYSSDSTDSAPPVVTVAAPNGGEKLFTAVSSVVRWTVEQGDAVESFDVQVSANNGTTYSNIPGCTALQPSARQCPWTSPSPGSTTARVRVVARHGSTTTADASDAVFTIASTTPFVTVTAPNTAVNWGRGSRQQITWTHNLGSNTYVRIDASRDGGATFTEIAHAIKNTSATAGSFDWTVSGPNSTAAVIRVSWAEAPVSDVSNVSFTIADPYIAVTRPAKGSNWGFGTQQSQAWTSNLGPGDLVDVALSVDGAQTFPTVLSSGTPASAKSTKFLVPALGQQTSLARIRVRWANPSSGTTLAATSPVNFILAPPFVQVTSPNGGEIWVAGTKPVVRWVHNLGSLEGVAIHLSLDGGTTYETTIVGGTVSDGSHVYLVGTTAVSTAARVRVSWLKQPGVADVSDAPFQVLPAP